LFRGEYFFGLMLVVGLIYVSQLRRRLQPLVAADPTLKRGARVLVTSALVLVLAATIVQGGLQYFGGFSRDVSWWASCHLDNPYVAAELIFQATFACVAMWWAWFANGPVRIQKYREALVGGGQNPFELGPTGLRWSVTIACCGFMTMRAVLWFVRCRSGSG
jgi:hypothetical protein